MDSIISVRDLRKVYGVRQRKGWRFTTQEMLSVNDISFDVPAGQAIAFIGPNGAGKSTTIRMLTGILRPTAGEVTVLGRSPWRDRSKLAYEIGAVFGQRSQLWYHLPPDDTFELLSRIYDMDRSVYRNQRDLLIERFNLAPILKQPVRKLSLGQRMRAEVAASLLHRPKLLFLDEPTIGLDINARHQLRNLISEWNREHGMTVFLTSHDTGDIESVAERVMIIKDGRIALDDTVDSLKAVYPGQSLEATVAQLFSLEVEDVGEPELNEVAVTS